MRASGLLRSYLKVTGHGVPIFWRKKGAIPFNILKNTLKDMVFKRIENEVLAALSRSKLFPLPVHRYPAEHGDRPDRPKVAVICPFAQSLDATETVRHTAWLAEGTVL